MEDEVPCKDVVPVENGSHEENVPLKTVVLASGNPVKARATERGFQRVFPQQTFKLVTVSVPSGVPDQPFGDAETLLGAENRAVAAEGEITRADFWVGLEGGIADQQGEHGNEMLAFAWVAVRSRSQVGKSRTATLVLPPAVADLVRQGHELGEADDMVFGRSNSKQQEGAVGLLTDGVIDRAGLYEPAVVLALIPFLNPRLYGG